MGTSLSLQEAKDQVARDKNFRDWIDMCARDHYTNMEHAADKIAQIYGDSQYNQALTDVYELLKVEGDNVKYHNQIQQLIKLKR